MDGDCGIHSVIASLQVNSARYDLTTEELMSKMNLVTGSGYWWSLEELSTLVSKIGCGLFAIEHHVDKKVLHYFNPQRVLKRNVFLRLKNNHFEVIDLKKGNGLDFDMICEITEGTSEKVIHNSILKHMSQRLKNDLVPPPIQSKDEYPELRQQNFGRHHDAISDDDQREIKSFDRTNQVR